LFEELIPQNYSLEELGISFLETKEKETNTYKAYKTDLKFLLKTFDNLNQLNNLNNLRDLRIKLKENYNQKTFLRRWSVLREFLRFCEQRKQIKKSLILNLDFYSAEEQSLKQKTLELNNLKQREKLLELVCNTPKLERDQAILWFLYSTGIKVSELTKFGFIKNLNLASSEFYLKERVTFLASTAVFKLETYFKTRTKLSLEEPIFLSTGEINSSESIKESYVYQIFQKSCQQVGLNFKISDLRDSLILKLLLQKAPIEQIQYLLGIKSRKTLEPLLKIISDHPEIC